MEELFLRFWIMPRPIGLIRYSLARSKCYFCILDKKWPRIKLMIGKWKKESLYFCSDSPQRRKVWILRLGIFWFIMKFMMVMIIIIRIARRRRFFLLLESGTYRVILGCAWISQFIRLFTKSESMCFRKKWWFGSMDLKKLKSLIPYLQV